MSSPNQSPVPAYNRRVSYETRATTCLVVSLRYINPQSLLCSNKKRELILHNSRAHSGQQQYSEINVIHSQLLSIWDCFPIYFSPHQTGFSLQFSPSFKLDKIFSKDYLLRRRKQFSSAWLGKINFICPWRISRISWRLLFSQKRYV